MLQAERQLKALRGELQRARTELATLMNVRPGTDFTIAAAQAPTPTEVLDLPASIDELELSALTNRAEVRGEAYQGRINARETKVQILRMLPGLEFTGGATYEGNSYLLNNTWASGGLELTWNLLNLVSGPRNIELAETREALSETRRHALSMAVLSQVHIANLAYQTAVEDFRMADRLADVDKAITGQLEAAGSARQMSRQQIIQGRINAALTELRRDMAYAEMQAAWGRIFATIGADPLPGSLPSEDVKTVAAAVARTFDQWRDGDIWAENPADMATPMALDALNVEEVEAPETAEAPAPGNWLGPAQMDVAPSEDDRPVIAAAVALDPLAEGQSVAALSDQIPLPTAEEVQKGQIQLIDPGTVQAMADDPAPAAWTALPVGMRF